MSRVPSLLFVLVLLGPAPAAAAVLYGATGGATSDLYVLDPATGAVHSTVGPIGFAVTGLAVHPVTGVLYGSVARNDPGGHGGKLIAIDKATGQGAIVGSFGIGDQTMADLTFAPDGTLHGWAEPNEDDLYTIDVATGLGTLVGESDLATAGSGLAADACGTLFFAGLGAQGTLHLIDRATGRPTALSVLDGVPGQQVAALAVEPTSGALYGAVIDVDVAARPAWLVRIDPQTGRVSTLGPSLNRLDAIAFDGPAPAPTSLVASILPASRSVAVGGVATAFATVINAGPAMAVGVGIAPLPPLPVDFSFQTTSAATNAPVGRPDRPACIPAGGAQSFVIALAPTGPFGPVEATFAFAGSNTAPVAPIVGVNTLLVSASTTPVPDVVALAATLTSDGIANVPGPTGTGVFAVATVNVGSEAVITVSADTGGAVLPLNLFVCRTDPGSGLCASPPAPAVDVVIGEGETPTFSVFLQGTGPIAFDPAAHRAFVRFRDGGGAIRGATSVAVRTE